MDVPGLLRGVMAFGEVQGMLGAVHHRREQPPYYEEGQQGG